MAITFVTVVIQVFNMCLRSQDRNRSSLRMEFSTLALHMSTSAHEESVIFTGRGAPENWGIS